MMRLLALALGLAVVGCGDAPYYLNIDSGIVDGAGVDDAGVDASVDALRPDAPPDQVAFDIGFASRWFVGSEAINMSSDQWVRIVNKGSLPLDLSTASVVNVVASTPSVPVTAEWGTVTTVLEPDRSAGALSAAAASLIVTSGLVTEPAQNTSDELILLTATFPPQWTFVDVEISVEIGNARATLPVRLYKGSPNTGPGAAPDEGQRAQSVPF